MFISKCLHNLKRLFAKRETNVTCPRCLGKGHVNVEDIARLQREWEWIPGVCAYCLGECLVPASMLSMIPADEPYLTLGLSAEERQALIDNKHSARIKKKFFEEDTQRFIHHIQTLHFDSGLNAEEIADVIIEQDPLLSQTDPAGGKNDLIIYINRIIAPPSM